MNLPDFTGTIIPVSRPDGTASTVMATLGSTPFALLVMAFLVATKGTPTPEPLPQWVGPLPDPSVTGAGLPGIPGGRSVTLYNSTLPNGTKNPSGLYNHGPMLLFVNGSFLCMWYNGPEREYERNRVVVATSRDAVAWTAPTEVFPSVNQHGEENEPFVQVNGRVYAAASDRTWGNNHDSGLQGAILMRQLLPHLGGMFWVADRRPGPSVTNQTDIPMWDDMDHQTQADV